MTEPTSRAIVPARALIAMNLFVSDEETRFYLKGIHIEPHEEGAMMHATNGQVLMSMLVRGAVVEGPSQIWTIPAKKLLSPIIRAEEKSDSFRVWCDLKFTPGEVSSVTLETRGCVRDDPDLDPRFGYPIQENFPASEKALAVVDGTFPDIANFWRRNRVAHASTSWGQVQSRYLGDLIDFTRVMHGGKLGQSDGHFRFWRTGDESNSPWLVTFADTPDAACIVMPIRAGDAGSAPDPLMIGWLADLLGDNDPNEVEAALTAKKKAA